ncbi:MAG: transcription antitermination factor NusB [Candidatus Peribacteraceae bacterium]|nr:transcription antitermination factor NusB [Candidatus Peribacteraceae bacterium]
MPSKRRLARIAAMQTVFEVQARDVDPTPSLERNIGDFGGNEHVDCAFSQSLIAGVRKHWDAIQHAIEEHAPQWPWQRMDAMTRSILLIGGYELFFAKDAPPAVVMNEAIEIAKEYGTDESAKFVNGVLNALAHAQKKN